MSTSSRVTIYSYRRRGPRPHPSFAARARGMTPPRQVVRGLVADSAGAAAMDALLYATSRRGNGQEGFELWESSSGLDSWERAPAPAQVGKRLVEGLFARELSPRRARLLNNITHWAYGILAGVRYGIVAGSLRTPRICDGLPFGAGVWAAEYVVLPSAGPYEPIWRYDRVTLTKDLTTHLAYEVGTATALRLLAGTSGAAS